MKIFSILLLPLLLTACSQTTDTLSSATPGEIKMAEMMGVSVEELRHQTPEDHMKMMQNMAHKAPSEGTTESLHECGADGKPCSCHAKQEDSAKEVGRKQGGGCGCANKAACADRPT
ncbi:hypothetical protein COU76_03230 [Candidatus Peregrinibacteria bacterium CG10_big_fil_rev_8_21_14_0_10_49_10]|nr:MAG: hypothetical protein COU76_03230 [Candidatus Peregrinibacteria bacterium CG10_big_fil_rev_8_21_14_0_10_49_10]